MRLPVEIPGRPVKLDAVAAAEWDRIVPLLATARRVSANDGPMLAIYCSQWSQFVRLAKILSKPKADLTRLSTTFLKVAPEVATLVKLMHQFGSLVGHFGLSPATRSMTSSGRRKPLAHSELEGFRSHLTKKQLAERYNELLTGELPKEPLPAPSWLNATARKIYDNHIACLSTAGVCSQLDYGIAIMSAVAAELTLRSFQAGPKELHTSYIDSDGNEHVREHPLFEVQRQLVPVAKSLLHHIGGSPASRLKIILGEEVDGKKRLKLFPGQTA